MIYVGGHTRTLNNVWRTADIIASVTVGVYDSTIRKWLSKTSIRKRVPMQKPVLTKKITKAHLTSSLNNKPQDFGENSLFTTKSGSFWPITSTINMPLCLQEHHQGSGSVMGWGCFTASQPGQLGVIDGTPFLLSVAICEKTTHQFVTSSSLGFHSRALIRSTSASSPGKEKWRNWSGPVTVWMWLRYSGMTLNKPFVLTSPNHGWIETILDKLHHKSSSVMWKTHCQLSQRLIGYRYWNSSFSVKGL